MRKGEDRHQVGAEVFELLFPEGAPLVRGLALGSDAAEVEARLGPSTAGSSPYERTWAVDDPHGNQRRVVVSVAMRLALPLGRTRAEMVTARWLSADRLDIDSAWTKVREHLERLHGRPDKEVGNVLKLIWRVGPGPTRIVTCRYRDLEGNNLLELVTRNG